MTLVKLEEKRNEPVQHVIDVLEDLTRRAKAGEIQGVAVACVCDGRSIATTLSLGPGQTADVMLAMAQMKARLLEGLEDA
jgi:hypothetical protein